MTESIYNIFLHYANGICSSISYVVHEVDLSDDDAMVLLQTAVESDFTRSKNFILTKPFTLAEYNAKCRLGEGPLILNDFFDAVGAGPEPLFVATPVRGGKPYFECSSRHNKPLDMADIAEKLGERGVMVDWLAKYKKPEGIDITQLIHDDYFLAIKLTYNAGLHVSAMKLLLSCIDSLAYIEFGDNRQSTPFIDWLNAYADLAPLGISAAELWELRNGLLHMSNTNSSKVRNNKIRRISFSVGGLSALPSRDDDIYYFNFYKLILEFAAAQERWIATYNADREKFVKFVERYDETISDSRVTVFSLSNGRETVQGA